MTRTVRVLAVALFVAIWMGGSAYAMYAYASFQPRIWLGVHAASTAFLVPVGALLIRLVRRYDPVPLAPSGLDILWGDPAAQAAEEPELPEDTVGFGAGNLLEHEVSVPAATG